MADPTKARCPACAADRMDQGRSGSHEYDHGFWIGCTKCGFSISGPDHAKVKAAMRAVQQSTAMKDLRNG